jgi:hypothetical protein
LFPSTPRAASEVAAIPSQPAVQMNTKSKRRTNLHPLMGFRPTLLLRAAIITWAERQAEKPTLSESLCRLVERGLTVREDGSRFGDGQKRRARKMAGDAIVNMIDATTAADDRAARKRHLLTGPEEFTRVRVDRPKGGKSIRR